MASLRCGGLCPVTSQAEATVYDPQLWVLGLNYGYFLTSVSSCIVFCCRDSASCANLAALPSGHWSAEDGSFVQNTRPRRGERGPPLFDSCRSVRSASGDRSEIDLTVPKVGPGMGLVVDSVVDPTRPPHVAKVTRTLGLGFHP